MPVGGLSIDASQLAAVVTFLKSSLSVIQGVSALSACNPYIVVKLANLISLSQPPGTGKTNTIVAALYLLKRKCRFRGPVSVNAHTHKAIESLARRSLQTGLKIVMLGKLSEGSGLEEQHLVSHMKRHQWWPILCAFQSEMTRLYEETRPLAAELAGFENKKKKFPGMGRTYRRDQIRRIRADLGMCLQETSSCSRAVSIANLATLMIQIP